MTLLVAKFLIVAVVMIGLRWIELREELGSGDSDLGEGLWAASRLFYWHFGLILVSLGSLGSSWTNHFSQKPLAGTLVLIGIVGVGSLGCFLRGSVRGEAPQFVHWRDKVFRRGLLYPNACGGAAFFTAAYFSTLGGP